MIGEQVINLLQPLRLLNICAGIVMGMDLVQIIENTTASGRQFEVQPAGAQPALMVVGANEIVILVGQSGQ